MMNERTSFNELTSGGSEERGKTKFCVLCEQRHCILFCGAVPPIQLLTLELPLRKKSAQLSDNVQVVFIIFSAKIFET
jgi:hypothetical protein